jgi:rare lipoprotein A
MYALTAAHPSLPFGTLLRVRHLESGREVVVRVNDRGPFARGRILDLSHAAAEALGMIDAGETQVALHHD